MPHPACPRQRRAAGIVGDFGGEGQRADMQDHRPHRQLAAPAEQDETDPGGQQQTEQPKGEAGRAVGMEAEGKRGRREH